VGSSVSSSHSNGTAFVFVPNLCNARCDFCYVRPVFAESAKASAAVLHRGRITAAALSELGFTSVRFTGGEPTIFSNFDELVSPFINVGLTYRVLTNGFSLGASLDYFRTTPPERFTISVHTTRDPATVFGVPLSVHELSRTRRTLAAIADVEATIVVEDAGRGWDELDSTLADLVDDGVSDVKVILENSRQRRDREIFYQAALRLRGRWASRLRTLRFTDPTQSACLLKAKGFPSIDLGLGIAYACCVQVGDRAVAEGYSLPIGVDATTASRAIRGVTEHGRRTEASVLPCSAGQDFCPLALTS
jgi:MoaA/NifB/PqqE/SkfB family radical SAM enzyme